MLKRYLILVAAFFLGSTFIAGVYFGILTWAHGWDSALNVFLSNRWYVIPIWISFGIQAAVYSILRFRLFVPVSFIARTGTVMGTSGGTSVTAMVACCLHHVTDVLPVLGLSTTPTPADDPVLLPTLFPSSNDNSELTRLDAKGGVVFDVTPLDPGAPAETLEFDVAMNTHSVDLSMDLATLSTFSTDTGVTVHASQWDAIPGGHDVASTLIFLAMKDGKSILEGASKLTLTIVNFDAASRVFEWELK